MSRNPAPQVPIPAEDVGALEPGILRVSESDDKSPEDPVKESQSYSGSTRARQDTDVVLASVNESESVVTRRELWSYYREWQYFAYPHLSSYDSTVYYNGDNVCTAHTYF